jgi:hypothetical protein
MPYFYPGDTVTLGVGDVTLKGIPVTTGATVTIQLFNPDGTQSGADFTGVVDGDDWTIDVNLPSSPLGNYTIKLTVVKSGATWHGKVEDLWIRSF